MQSTTHAHSPGACMLSLPLSFSPLAFRCCCGCCRFCSWTSMGFAQLLKKRGVSLKAQQPPQQQADAARPAGTGLDAAVSGARRKRRSGRSARGGCCCARRAGGRCRTKGLSAVGSQPGQCVGDAAVLGPDAENRAVPRLLLSVALFCRRWRDRPRCGDKSLSGVNQIRVPAAVAWRRAL